MTPMDPIPETVEALDELDAAVDAQALLARLRRLATDAQELVPDLVGVSICPFEQGLTFTFLTSAERAAVLDGVQYLAGGPCVDGAHDGAVHEFHGTDVLDEERWRLFAEATAAHSVRSTLTLPVDDDGRIVGTVNLYAASAHAFAAHHDELAALFGAAAAGLVTNADLSFSTRDLARAAPDLVREQLVLDVAVGILAAELGLDVDAAESRLRDAAGRAGVSVTTLARAVVDARDHRA